MTLFHYTVHNEYLDNVHEHCLQTEKFEDLTQTIYKVFLKLISRYAFHILASVDKLTR